MLETCGMIDELKKYVVKGVICVRCRKCKKGAKFRFDLNTYGWIELVKLIKNITFKIIFGKSLAEKFSKHRVHSTK